MSGTDWLLTPFRMTVAASSAAGTTHWCGVPSLTQGVNPPCRWSVPRFWEYGWRVLLAASYPEPAPMTVVSTGMGRLPPTEVAGRLFVNLMRVGTFRTATSVGP